ncbi:MAG: 50S ribosomal protein L16 [Candidatus Dojkabacteria bacterium]|nr:MAG: 50S ribosomal protein L16 [Candidatus Dojkabacteria bacterium]
MLQQPKKLKFRKPHTVVPRNRKPVVDSLSFGSFGIMSIENALVSANQLDAARRAIVGYVKRKGKLWMKVFPDRPVTKHPAETRMGSGKGDVDFFAAVVKKGRIIFELGGVEEKDALEAFRRAAHKLSVKVKIVRKQ